MDTFSLSLSLSFHAQEVRPLRRRFTSFVQFGRDCFHYFFPFRPSSLSGSVCKCRERGKERAKKKDVDEDVDVSVFVFLFFIFNMFITTFSRGLLWSHVEFTHRLTVRALHIPRTTCAIALGQNANCKLQ